VLPIRPNIRDSRRMAVSGTVIRQRRAGVRKPNQESYIKIEKESKMVTIVFQLPDKFRLPPELGLPKDDPVIFRVLNDQGAHLTCAACLAGLNLGALEVAPTMDPSLCLTQPQAQVHPDMPEYQLPQGNWTSQN
jgi:hypothetical protein